jgi:hypothetical protein
MEKKIYPRVSVLICPWLQTKQLGIHLGICGQREKKEKEKLARKDVSRYRTIPEASTLATST